MFSLRFTVAFTAERFIVVAYPLKRTQYKSQIRARYAIGILNGIALLLNSSSLWTSGLERSSSERITKRCVTLAPWLNFTRKISLIDFFLTFIIPFVTIVILNTLIIIKSGQYDRLLERNCTRQSPYLLQNVLGHRIRRLKYHRRITRMLLTVSTVFLVLNTPLHLLRVYYFFFSNEQQLGENNSIESIIEILTFNLFYTNFSINFLLYSLCGKNFRSSLMNLIRHMGRSQPNVASSTHISENMILQFYQRSNIAPRYSKRELSSIVSTGHFNANMYASVPSTRRNSLKSELIPQKRIDATLLN